MVVADISKLSCKVQFGAGLMRKALHLTCVWQTSGQDQLELVNGIYIIKRNCRVESKKRKK